MMLQCGWTLGLQALILLALWHCASHVTSGMCYRYLVINKTLIF